MKQDPLSILKDELARAPGVSAWRIRDEDVEGRELYFIRRELDMNRAKAVRRLTLTVYHDYRAEGRDWRGAAKVRLHPTSDRREIRAVLDRALAAAALVRNPPHPLARPAAGGTAGPASGPAAGELSDHLEPLCRAVFAEDNHGEGGLNSSEIFLERSLVRILNSEGVDVRYQAGRVLIELIADWRADGEEVEIYRELRFAGVDEAAIREQVRELLQYARDRSRASLLSGKDPGPARKVLLTGAAVPEFLGYYLAQSAAENVYRQISSLEVGREVQGGARGGGLTLRLLPYLPGSSVSAPYDGDGHLLREVTVIEKGVLRRYWGPVRFCHYLGCEPTGSIRNFAVEPGDVSAAALRRDPYLEVVSFSDFQCDPLTGDFGGEIRLAYLGRGEERRPVTGGSVSGNLRQVQEKMSLSAEVQARDGFRGPRTLGLLGASITPAGD